MFCLSILDILGTYVGLGRTQYRLVGPKKKDPAELTIAMEIKVIHID